MAVYSPESNSRAQAEAAVAAMVRAAKPWGAPPELVEDLVYALIPAWCDRASSGGEDAARRFWHQLTARRKWRFLVQRIEIYRRRIMRTQAPAETQRSQRLFAAAPTQAVSPEDRFRNVLQGLMRDIVSPMMAVMRKRGLIQGELLTWSEAAVDEMTDEGDFDELAPDALLAKIEIIMRTGVLLQVDAVIEAAVIDECLRQKWIIDDFDPRQLSPVTKLGDRSEVLPGDYLGVRGITKKMREDQIPKILPSEYASWHSGPSGQLITLDKIINRAPSCLQHFDTRSPHSRHRLLIVIAMSGVRSSGGGVEPMQIGQRTCAFNLLVHAALKVPPENIDAHVVWLEGLEEGRWRGSAFPLSDLRGATAEEELSWRNVADVDRLAPDEFVKSTKAKVKSYKFGMKPLSERPSDVVGRLVAGGRFDAACVAAIGTGEHLLRALPSRVAKLPGPRGVPQILLVSTEPRPVENAAAREEPGEADEAKNDDRPPPWTLKAAAHLNLLAARMGAGHLATVTSEELAASWLWMLIGGFKDEAVLPSLLGRVAR